MVIKLVVGERDELDRLSRSGGGGGFWSFINQLWARIDHDTGELDLDDEDLARMYRYMNRGHKKKLLRLFGRTLGPDLGGLNR